MSEDELKPEVKSDKPKQEVKADNPLLEAKTDKPKAEVKAVELKRTSQKLIQRHLLLSQTSEIQLFLPWLL
jgi:hypothetical protein